MFAQLIHGYLMETNHSRSFEMSADLLAIHTLLITHTSDDHISVYSNSVIRHLCCRLRRFRGAGLDLRPDRGLQAKQAGALVRVRNRGRNVRACMMMSTGALVTGPVGLEVPFQLQVFQAEDAVREVAFAVDALQLEVLGVQDVGSVDKGPLRIDIRRLTIIREGSGTGVVSVSAVARGGFVTF